MDGRGQGARWAATRGTGSGSWLDRNYVAGLAEERQAGGGGRHQRRE
jgi:hypothetical protein